MPISTAPYKRNYKQGTNRGNESKVRCDGCGKMVPRFKTFVRTRGMRIKDPAILRQIDKRMIHLMKRKVRLCPSCARHRGVSNPGKSSRKKYGGREKHRKRRR